VEPEGARVAVGRCEEELREATLRNDAKATDRLLADDWINVGPDGSVTDKKGLLKIIKDFKFHSITDEDTRIRIFGDSAVVTGASVRVLSGPGGRPVTRKVRFTRVWVNREDGWVVVSAQSTVIADS
jgi:ketosteroid isomerase-like protein